MIDNKIYFEAVFLVKRNTFSARIGSRIQSSCLELLFSLLDFFAVFSP